MTISSALLGAEDPRWAEALEQIRHDVYHLPSYVNLLANRAGAEAAAILVSGAGEELIVPLLLRRLPDGLGEPGWRDGTSPYGYPGPLFSATADEAVRGALWRGLVEQAGESDLVSLFIRSHPLLTPAPDTDWAATEVVEHGRVVYVDLSEDLETIRRQRRGDTERDLRSLKEDGFDVVMNDWDRYDGFIRIYRETMRRVGADDYYLFENGYFNGLRKALGAGLHLCSVVAPTGETAAGGLFMERDGLYQYHLGATNGEYRSESPSKLMFDRVIEWAQGRGGTHLNLGGGLGAEEDSLFHFKKGWSDHTRPFHSIRVVPDETRYRTLLIATGEDIEDERAGFFPGYRRTKA